MKFAQTFIKHHVMTILLYILVVVFGFYSFQNLPLALMPSMEVPAAVVYATYPGAGPEDIEQQVTKKLEGAVAGLSGLEYASVHLVREYGYAGYPVYESYGYGSGND